MILSSGSSDSASSAAKSFALDPEVVRTLAASTGCQELIRERDDILSYWAFDSSLVEQFSGDVDDDDDEKKQSDSVARVDVYCLSGTVIISRAASFPILDDTTTASTDDQRSECIGINDDYSGSGESISEAPVVDVNKSQIRRIIRHNVTQGALRCIFSNPPKLAAIDESICAPISNVNHHVDEEENEVHDDFTRDELARMHVANAILNTEMGGDDLERAMQLDAFDNKATDEIETSKSHEDRTDQLLSLQLEIRKKIEIADTGLAILMGEREKLEKIMGIEKKEERATDTDESLEEDVSSLGYRNDESTKSESSTSQSSESDAEDSLDERIRLMGCEVEYSFPSFLADELEAALIDQNNDDLSDTDEDCDNYVGRGRSKTKRKILPGERKPKRRQLRLSPIKFIPTNGEGCVILRENGAFNVVGSIPKILEKHLFRDDAPYPGYVALGSKKRYFVQFDDDSYYFHGPSSLSRILNEKLSKTKKDVGKKGAKNQIASIAFGKDQDAFFIVFKDGSWECGGELHDELDKLLNDRGNRADLEWVSLGPDDEFCLKAKNGRLWWGGVSHEISETLFDITDRDDTAVFYMSFGFGGSYFCCHRS